MTSNSHSKNHSPPRGVESPGAARRLQFSSFTAALLAVAFAPAVAAAAGPAVQLLWSTQPGSATVGAPFGRQPVLIAADAAGNPSTAGLAETVTVTVDSEPAGALHGGPITFNIGVGPGGSNGVAALQGLQIDSGGGYSLVATTGNGTNAVFSPTNGLPQCKLWLDASDPAALTVGTGNHVQLWADKSGSGNNATNINADGVANTPLTNANPNLAAFSSGGQHVLSFYGTNRLSVDFSYITNSAYSIVSLTLLDPAVTPANDYYMGTPFTGGGVDQVLHIGYRNTSQYTWAQYADDLNVGLVTSPLIASHIHPANQKQLYFNGVSAGTQNGAKDLGYLLRGYIGQGNGGNFHGDIAEVIVYSTNLTDIQRMGVENYLANKWLGQLSASAVSTPFFVGNGNAVAGLRFGVQPSETVAGTVIYPSVTVLVTNAQGTGLPGLPVALTLASGSGPLNGTLTMTTDSGGIATFGDLYFTIAGEKQLQATIPGAATNLSSTFKVVAGSPVQLAIRTQPSATATAGVPFGLQPVVSIEDAFGNVVSNATDLVLASETANGNLNQTANNTVQVSAVAGIATFSGLFLTNAGTSTLTFSSGWLPAVNSANIAVTPGAPASILVQQEPSTTAQVGVSLETQPIVAVADIYGNAVANGTPVLASASAGSLLGQTSVGTATGVATFSGLALTNLGTVTLQFTAGAASARSAAINVGPGPATTVVWTTQPGNATAGSPLGQQPVLKTADAGGNITTLGLGPTNLVVVHLISGSGLVGETLTYNIGTSGSNGVITFQNLQINTAGTSNILAADFLGSTANPTNTIPNCVLWLDAYDGRTLTMDGTNLVVWADKSGTGNNATNTANYPTVAVNAAVPTLAYGGQRLVSFGGDNWLNLSLASITNSAFTIFVADVLREVPGATYFIGSQYNGVDASLHVGYRNANTFTLAQYADDLNYASPGNFAYSSPRVWSMQLADDFTQSISLDGMSKATRTAVAFLGPLVQESVGRASGGNYRGDLAEVVVYNRALDATERATVEQYLMHKWEANSRAVSTPFAVLSLAPTLSLSQGTGGNATLTVSGAPGHTYRVLTSSNLTAPAASWTAIGTNTLGSSGLWQLSIPQSQPVQYYRAVTP